MPKKIFASQKDGPPKIGGPVRPNRSNVPKAGPANHVDAGPSCILHSGTVTLAIK